MILYFMYTPKSFDDYYPVIVKGIGVNGHVYNWIELFVSMYKC
jgi:hypothetical protein